MVQFAGGPKYETQTVIFYDTVSIAKGNNFITCGNRQYSITSVNNTAIDSLNAAELYIDPTTGGIHVYTDRWTTKGTHTATVTARL